MQYDEKFVRRLTLAAQAKCGSVSKLNDEIGASEKSIYKWINGTSMPKAVYLLAMLDMMGYLVDPAMYKTTYPNVTDSAH